MSQVEWDAFQKDGAFPGSGIDLRDGFIHMSTAAAVRDTANLYFKAKPDVFLLRVDLSKVPQEHLKWDFVASRGVEFPHLYDVPLPLGAVGEAFGPLRIGADGKFELPAEIP